MKNNSNDWKKFYVIVVGICVLCVIVSVAIPVIINESYTGSGYMTQWGAVDMLGYTGSILGAVFGMIGVIITIIYTNRVNNEQWQMAYKPRIYTHVQNAVSVDDFNSLEGDVLVNIAKSDTGLQYEIWEGAEIKNDQKVKFLIEYRIGNCGAAATLIDTIGVNGNMFPVLRPIFVGEERTIKIAVNAEDVNNFYRFDVVMKYRDMSEKFVYTRSEEFSIELNGELQIILHHRGNDYIEQRTKLEKV